MPIPQDVAISAMPWTFANVERRLYCFDPDEEISSRIEAIRQRFGLTPAGTTFAIEMVRATADRLQPTG